MSDGRRNLPRRPELPPTFSIELESDGVRDVIRPVGELDAQNTDALDSTVAGSFGTDAEAIVLDLSGLQFIDSTGIHALLRAAARSRADGNRLTITGPRGQVARLLRLTGLRDRLPLG